MPPLRPVTAEFFDTAPERFRYTHELPVPPATVWASLVSPNSVADWTPLLQRIEWTSELGPGATRRVVLPGSLVRLDEYFFRWEEGRRYSFHATSASAPLFRAFAEDYLVEPAPGGGTRFTWTFAAEGGRATRYLLRALRPVTGLAFGRMAAGSESFFRA